MNTKRWIITGFLAVMLVGAGVAQADVFDFNGIPGGDFSEPAFSSNLPLQTFDGQGSWSYSNSSSSASSTVVGTGADRHLELSTLWYPRIAQTFYTSTTSSGADDSWKVSADLNAAPNGNGNADRRFVVGKSVNAVDWTFTLNFKYTSTTGSVEWAAGSQSGTVTPTGTIKGVYETVSLEYDGLTGKAKAMLGDEVLFDVTTETGLAGIDTIYFNKYDKGTYDTGKFYVDNVTAVPEPMTVGLLAVGGLLGIVKRKNRIKV